MAIVLIVEDGTIVADANSYNDLAAIRVYAVLRNRTLPLDDDSVKAYAIRAMDYLESFRDQYKGAIVDAAQLLAFPRTGVKAGNVEYADDVIPQLIKNAQMQLVIELAAGVELFPTFVRLGRVKRKKIGPLETEWFDGQQTGLAPVIIAVDWMIEGFLNQQVGLKTVRV